MIPHPRGDLRVAWQANDGDLVVTITLPVGLTHRVAPRGRLAQLRLRVVLEPSADK